MFKNPKCRLVKIVALLALFLVGSVPVAFASKSGVEARISPKIAQNSPVSLDILISKLGVCESNRRTDIIHTDIDGVKVFGEFQFKWTTFQAAVRKFGFRNKIELEDILNPSLQRQTVKALLSDNPRNYLLWKNCSGKIGLDKFMKDLKKEIAKK